MLWLSNVVRASAGGSIIQLLCFAQEEEGQPGAGRTRMRTRKRALTAKTDQQRGALPETLKTWLCTPIPAGSPHKDCSCGPRGRKCRSSRNFEAPAGPNSSLKRTPLPRPRLRYANETQGSDKKRAAVMTGNEPPPRRAGDCRTTQYSTRLQARTIHRPRVTSNPSR